MIPVENESRSSEAQPHGLYEVLVNQEEDFMVWPVDQDIPYSTSHWQDTGKRGTEEECLGFVEEHEW